MKKKLSKHIEKIVVSVGVGRLREGANFDDKILPEIVKELSLITGQKPAVRRAKKSIAGFKIRKGDIVGLQVTLRGRRMEDFFTRVFSIAVPRVKDFRGIELKNVDASGNLNIGFREQYVFPEIAAEESKVRFGLQVTVVPREKKRDKVIEFYKENGVPLKTDKIESRK